MSGSGSASANAVAEEEPKQKKQTTLFLMQFLKPPTRATGKTVVQQAKTTTAKQISEEELVNNDQEVTISLGAIDGIKMGGACQKFSADAQQCCEEMGFVFGRIDNEKKRKSMEGMRRMLTIIVPAKMVKEEISRLKQKGNNVSTITANILLDHKWLMTTVTKFYSKKKGEIEKAEEKLVKDYPVEALQAMKDVECKQHDKEHKEGIDLMREERNIVELEFSTAPQNVANNRKREVLTAPSVLLGQKLKDQVEATTLKYDKLIKARKEKDVVDVAKAEKGKIAAADAKRLKRRKPLVAGDVEGQAVPVGAAGAVAVAQDAHQPEVIVIDVDDAAGGEVPVIVGEGLIPVVAGIGGIVDGIIAVPEGEV